MFDTELVDEILSQILTAAHRIERRSGDIFEPDDFLISDAGISNYKFDQHTIVRCPPYPPAVGTKNVPTLPAGLDFLP